jgi:hypothetical protein
VELGAPSVVLLITRLLPKETTAPPAKMLIPVVFPVIVVLLSRIVAPAPETCI